MAFYCVIQIYQTFWDFMMQFCDLITLQFCRFILNKLFSSIGLLPEPLPTGQAVPRPQDPVF